MEFIEMDLEIIQ